MQICPLNILQRITWSHNSKGFWDSQDANISQCKMTASTGKGLSNSKCAQLPDKKYLMLGWIFLLHILYRMVYLWILNRNVSKAWFIFELLYLYKLYSNFPSYFYKNWKLLELVAPINKYLLTSFVRFVYLIHSFTSWNKIRCIFPGVNELENIFYFFLSTGYIKEKIENSP